MRIALRVLGVGLLVVTGCSESREEPAQEARGGAGGTENGEAGGGDEGGAGAAGEGGAGAAGAAGATQLCDGAPLDCDDCPTLAQLREGCADASSTDCGGTMVGPLRSGPTAFTYCYDGAGELIGRIVVDTDVGSRSVEGSDCVAEGTSEPLCDGGPRSIIGAESEAIAISQFNFFSGGYLFERRLDQLSIEQLELAEAIRVVPPTGDCWSDATGMSITVTAGDEQQLYEANEFTGTCGGEQTLVDFEAVSALLATAHCLSSKGYDSSSAEKAPSIEPDSGCWHGLFNSHGDAPSWWFIADIPSAGDYQVTIADCGDRTLQLDLFEEDATTELASTTGENECPVLAYTFAAPGRYPLRLEMLSGSYAGDFYLGLDSVPPP